MKSPCNDCPKRPSCSTICSKLEESKGLAVLKTNSKSQTKFIENLREHSESKASPTAFEMTTHKDRERLSDILSRSISYKDVKKNRRFYAFLRCESITKIAKKANVSKQAIQKQFHRIIKKMTPIIFSTASRKPKKDVSEQLQETVENVQTEKTDTPHKFKDRIVYNA